MKAMLVILFTMILSENYVLVKFLGICPFLGVSKKLSSALGMSGAVVFVMGIASAATWCIYTWLLVPFGLEYLKTLSFIAVIAALVQLVEIILKKYLKTLYKALGIYLPLITTNCAVLGVVLQNTQNSYDFITSVVYGVTGGIGFLLVIVIFASIRERMEFSEWPKAFEGFPIALVAAGLIALSFMGFSGLKVF